jgi:hypothetical protein
LKVTITKADGTKDVITINTYLGDSTAWFEYIADQEGTWKLKFEFPGGYFPAGIYYDPKTGRNVTFTQSVYYKPSSTPELELVVKKDYVALSWPPSPLPTDYWTRPISIENREWWVIGGHYPFTGLGGGPNWPANTNIYASNYKFVPYVQGPTSAHIVWRRQGALAGIIGGQFGYRSYGPGEGTYAGTPSIIFQGRCYQSLTKIVNGVPTSVLQCYDLRTGEVYWERVNVPAPTTIAYNWLGAPSVPGAGETGIGVGGSWGFVRLVYIGAGRLIKYDPWSGATAINVSISPLTTGTLYRDPYVLSVQDLGAAKAPNRYRLINWTLVDWTETGATRTMAQRIISNVSWPFSSLGTCDFETGIAVTTYGIIPNATGVARDAGIMAARLKDGTLLWNITAGVGFNIFSGSTAVADHGKFAVRFDDGYWYCWRLSDGQRVWKSEMEEWPWGCFGAYNVASAYGLIYDLSYAGIYALDWNTGKIVWHYKYTAPYPYETPYNGSIPWFTNPIIADGKLYVANGEHSPTEPLMRGWRLHCINATTGEGIWNITGGGAVGAIADGYLTFDNRYDGYMYVFGKGKSSTTVTASPKTSAKGSQVLIEGTVLDLSPAQPGTPCVAKESMTQWMEYLHMQKPCPSDVKGVPVTLTAIKSDGKVIDLGTVTTNGFYGTFGFAWTPEEEGTYTIVASFAGDDSYGSSSAATYITVGPAPPTPETPEIPTPTDYTPMLTGLTIAVVIAIIIGIYSIYDHRRLMRK